MSSTAVTQLAYAGSKLYYTPTSCGAASVIVAHTLGLKGLQLEQVDLPTHTTKVGGKDFYTINPKGNVPTLVFPSGQILNEGAAVLQFLADQRPEANLAGQFGTWERYAVINALNQVSSEVHTQIGALFGATDANKEALVQRAQKKLTYLDKELKGQFMVNNRFTVADAYLFVVLNWIPFFHKHGLTIEPYANVKRYVAGIAAIPTVQEAQKLMANSPTTL